MKKIKKISVLSRKEILEVGLVSVFFLLIIAALSWWQISPSTYNEFDTTCQHFSYHDCMRWFNTTKPFFQRNTIISSLAALIGLIITLYLYFRKKK